MRILSIIYKLPGLSRPTSVDRNETLKPQANHNASETAKNRIIYQNYYKSTPYDAEFHGLIRDAYVKKWSHDDFKWNEDVMQNLRTSIDNMSPNELLRVLKMALPIYEPYPKEKLEKLEKEGLPDNPQELTQLKEELLKRQFQALKDITNHALTVEQAAIAPLSTGIITYRRYPPTQEALTLFISDEARHSGVFERYMTNNLQSQKYIFKDAVRNFDLFRHTAKIFPGAAVFLALAVETVGGSFFEFFGKRAPEPLFREICTRIATLDEKRHMVICRVLYKMVHDSNKTSKIKKLWENLRNQLAMRAIIKGYSENAGPNHYHMRAARALGIDPRELIDYITKRVKEEFAQIGFDFDPNMVPKYSYT